jgi:hypothetical protein
MASATAASRQASSTSRASRWLVARSHTCRPWCLLAGAPAGTSSACCSAGMARVGGLELGVAGTPIAGDLGLVDRVHPRPYRLVRVVCAFGNVLSPAERVLGRLGIVTAGPRRRIDQRHPHLGGRWRPPGGREQAVRLLAQGNRLVAVTEFCGPQAHAAEHVGRKHWPFCLVGALDRLVVVVARGGVVAEVEREPSRKSACLTSCRGQPATKGRAGCVVGQPGGEAKVPKRGVAELVGWGHGL